MPAEWFLFLETLISERKYYCTLIFITTQHQDVANILKNITVACFAKDVNGNGVCSHNSFDYCYALKFFSSTGIYLC